MNSELPETFRLPALNLELNDSLEIGSVLPEQTFYQGSI